MARISLLLVLLVGGSVLTSCDLASTGDTAILNAESAIPPTVRHRFEYTGDDASGNGEVEVVSSITSGSDLDDILSDNEFNRGDVVSARVDSVLVERISTNALSGADLYLGTDAGGPLIASVEFPSGQGNSALDTTTRSVTGAVKDGERKSFARFRIEDPDNIPAGGGVVRAVVYYRIEVEGI